MSTLPINAIVIGERVRKDMGDIAGLAESIKRHGLLHPVVVKADKTLVAGHRRIEAVRRLGWRDVPVTEIDVQELLTAERDENRERKDFTPTEAVAIGALIEQHELPKAEERRREGARRGVAVRDGKAEANPKVRPPSESGPVCDIVGRAVGMGATSYTKAKAVVAAAKEDPSAFGDLPEQMDATRNVSGTFRELQRRKGAPERHAVHHKSHHRDQSAELERGVWQIDAATKVLLTVEPEAVDKTRVAEWAKALTEARSNLGTILRRLKSVEK